MDWTGPDRKNYDFYVAFLNSETGLMVYLFVRFLSRRLVGVLSF